MRAYYSKLGLLAAFVAVLWLQVEASAAERIRLSGDRPFLRPPPSDAETRPTERLSISITRKPESLNADDKRLYPEGTVKRRLTLGGAGFIQMEHNEYTLPEMTTSNRAGSGGRRFAASGLTWFAPLKFFNLELALKANKASRYTDMLADSTCVAMTTHTATNWASGDMVFRHALDTGTNITLLLSFKRVAGDPFLYISVYASPEQTPESSRVLRLSGYPLSGASCLYGGGGSAQYPGSSSFFGFQRWIWLNGNDWNLCNGKEKHAADTDPARPPLMFWYNREANEMGGIMTVFLPEDVASYDASGTYAVSASLRMRNPVIRLALRDWLDWRGWEPVREEFIAASAGAAQRLRDLSFAWPRPDLVEHEGRRQVHDALAAASSAMGLADERIRLEQAMADYDRVLGEAKNRPARTDADICRQQQGLLLAKGEIDDALASLRVAMEANRKLPGKDGGAR